MHQKFKKIVLRVMHVVHVDLIVHVGQIVIVVLRKVSNVTVQMGDAIAGVIVNVGQNVSVVRSLWIMVLVDVGNRVFVDQDANVRLIVHAVLKMSKLHVLNIVTKSKDNRNIVRVGLNADVDHNVDVALNADVHR